MMDASYQTTGGLRLSARRVTEHPMGKDRTFLTTPSGFTDVSRGNPRPHTLKGDDLIRARLTPETWRLEIMAEGGCTIGTPLTLEKRNALDLATLEKLGRQHNRKFLKAMQCL